MGELSAEVLQLRGILGYVADGGCRDVDMIQKSGFSVYCRYFTPTDIVGRWLPERMGEAIRIGDVDISTGDYLLADNDGIAILPCDNVEELVTATEGVIRSEDNVRGAIREGMEPQAAYLKYRKF
jgi:regulator of RNase E activity RraA